MREWGQVLERAFKSIRAGDALVACYRRNP